MLDVKLKIGFIAVLSVLWASNSAFAQHTVTGIVQDTLGNPLSAVSVRLTTNQDTFSQITDKDGKYAFSQVKGNTLYLTFSILGYQVGYQSMLVLKENSRIEMPITHMQPMSFVIKDVHVIKILPIVIKEDTVQFNFDAYKFRPNSLLEEAIKSLPGWHVARDGSVYYNGKPIKKAKVDNKDFFGGDLLTATKNLPTGFIQSLQVIDSYEKMDEATGMKNSEPEKIINITLKPDKKQIYFGQVTMGGGTNERYLGSFGFNKFDDGREVSLVGSLNNTNTNIMYLGGMGVQRERSLLDVGDYADPEDGLNRVGSLGVNVSDKLGKLFSINTSYNFTHKKNVTEGFSKLTSSYIGNTIRRTEDYTLNTNDYNHNLKFDLKGTFSNRDEMRIQGNLTLSNQLIYNEKKTEIKNAQMENKGVFHDSTDFKSPNGDVEIFYSKYFAKKGRKLLGNLTARSNNLKRNELVNEKYWDISATSGDTTKPPTYLQDQLIYQNNITNSTNFALTYTEPFLEFGRFEFNYVFDITGIDAVRSVYDRLNTGDPLIIDSLKVNYDYYYKYNRFGLNYQHEINGVFKFNAGFAVEPLVLSGNLPLENTKYTYDNVNLIPTANLWYKISKDMDWQIDYRGKNNQPNFSQIAPVVDNSSSRNVIIGNPELKSEFSHRFSTRIRKSIPSKAQYLETSFAYSRVTDKIVSDKTSLSSSTIQQTTFKNATGYYDMRWFYVFNTPFIAEDLQLDLMGSTDYFNNPSYIDNRKRITKQLMVNQSLQLKYLVSDYFETGFIANYNLNNARYAIPYRTNISVNTMQWGLNTKTYLNDYISIGAEMSQRYNEGYTNSFMNINQTVINSFVEFTFLRNNVGLLRIQGFDLLDQNKNMGIYSEYIGNDVYEARNNRLGRYFMLSLNVRLQKYPKK